MKMSFKLGKTGTIAICTSTLLSIIVALLFKNGVTIIIAAVMLFCFYTCSQSKAFDGGKKIAWLVAVTSLIVSVAIIFFKILFFIIRWIFHLITRTPPPSHRFYGGKFFR